MNVALYARRRRHRARFLPAVMVEEGGVWYADTEPGAVAEAWWVDDGAGGYELDTAATEGYAVYVRRGIIYIDTGALIPVPTPVSGPFSVDFSADFE